MTAKGKYLRAKRKKKTLLQRKTRIKTKQETFFRI
jgi:hypothetical protein